MGDISLKYTLDEGLSTIGFGIFQARVLVYAGLGWVAEAMEIMLLSFVGPAIQPEWGLTSSQESLISTVAFAGMLVGAYSWGIVSDKFGRKKGFLGASLITTTAGFICAFAPNYTSLLILRCIIGFGLGCGHVFTTWFLEFVPTTNRGKWMIVFSGFWTVGTIVQASLAWAIVPRVGWRWLLGASAVPSLTLLLLYGLVPESPRYLCMKEKLTEARQILEMGALLNKKKLPSGLLVSDREMVDTVGDSTASKGTELDDSSITKKTQDYDKSSSSMTMLFSSKLIRTTLLLWWLFFGNTFSYYGIILLTSQLSDCGKASSSSTNVHDSSLYVNVFIETLAELPGLVLAAFIVDRVGRKLSMIIMLALGFITFLPLVVHQKAIVTTALFFIARLFVSATFTVACIYAPESYPTNLRATGVGIATAIGRIGGMVCPVIAVKLASGCRQTVPVIVFESVIAVTALSVVFLPLETKGRGLVDTVKVSSV